MSLVEGVEAAPFLGPLFYGRQEARLSEVCVCASTCLHGGVRSPS